MQAPGERRLETLSAEQVAEVLSLEPHPEGGFFRETYRAPLEIETEAGPRSSATAILYLFTESSPSRFHRLRWDELWFYHAGAPAWLVLLPPERETSPTATSSDEEPAGPSAGELPVRRMVGRDYPQALAPARWWVAAHPITGDLADWGSGWAPERRWTPDRRAASGSCWTLVSCVVTPGFVYEDFEPGDGRALLQAYPRARKAVERLS